MSGQFIEIPDTPASGRVNDFLNEINIVAANPELGASLQQLKDSHRMMMAAGRVDAFDETDLVTKLINDNQVLWNKLLTNTFCMKMKTAAKTDQAVLNGFKWYMRQDFFYIIKNCNYEADRGTKATNTSSFEDSMIRVGKRATFAPVLLKTCTAQPPAGLGITDSVVLSTRQTDALKAYIQFLIDAANTQSWVMSMVAVIACVQSYYLIAVDLKDHSTHKDTPWYNLWAIPNSQYGDSAERQKTFFKQNYAQWKDHYAQANTMFQKACQAEINLWETALHPES